MITNRYGLIKTFKSSCLAVSLKLSEAVAVLLAHTKRSATAGGPRYAIAGRSRNREHVHAMIEGLDEDFELAVTVEIID